MPLNNSIFGSGWNWLIGVSVALVLTLILVDFPLPPGPGLDASGDLVLVHAHLQNLQFGPDIVCSYGPWGFLAAKYSIHGTSWPKFLWETVGKLALAVTFVLLGWKLSQPRRLLFYASVIMAAAVFPATTLLLCTTLVSVLWLLGRESKCWQLVLAIAWLSLLSQMKFTYCILAVVALALAAASSSLECNWKRASSIIAGYLAGFLLWWLAAGQSIANLPIYLGRNVLMSNGYLQAVAVNEIPATVWWSAVAISLCFLVFTLGFLRGGTKIASSAFALGFCWIAWFLTWKHGFTRADAPHATTFFLHSLVFAIGVPTSFPSARWRASLNLVPVLSLLGLHLANRQVLPGIPGDLWRHLSNAPREILFFHERERSLLGAESRDKMEESRLDLQRLAQDGTIDVLSYELSEAIRPGLNYQPRPVFQSYLTFSVALAEMNLRFYQDDRAPRFVFARIESIDSRLAAQEDALLLEELPRRYSIAAEKADYILLERKPNQPAHREQSRDWMPKRQVRLGEEIMLPTGRDDALELHAFFKPTLYGRLRAFLVQPALLSIVLTDDQGQKFSRRLIPSMAETGFLVQPFFATQQEFGALFGGHSPHLIRSISFASSTSGCWSKAKIQVCWLTELPLKAPGAGNREVLQQIR